MDMTAAVRTALFDDLERELAVTRRVLERVPAERFGWKPHEKSMSLMGLAIHVADLPNWAREALEKDELDFEKAEMPPREVATTEALVAHFDRSAGRLRDVVAGFEVGRLGETWTMRQGAQVFTSQRKVKVYRTWSMNHLIHHRGQLCLYLRLLNVPVPTVYFNTADDPAMVFE
jgi:uncharacterized damage-inducible protein DinB